MRRWLVPISTQAAPPPMVYEFRDRAELDDYFRTEPYCVNGTYQHIEIYDSTRSPHQGKEGRQ